MKTGDTQGQHSTNLTPKKTAVNRWASSTWQTTAHISGITLGGLLLAAWISECAGSRVGRGGGLDTRVSQENDEEGQEALDIYRQYFSFVLLDMIRAEDGPN